MDIINFDNLLRHSKCFYLKKTDQNFDFVHGKIIELYPKLKNKKSGKDSIATTVLFTSLIRYGS